MAVAGGRTQHGISAVTFYAWRAKYGGMTVSDMQRLRELERENAWLKRMYANQSLEYELLREVAESGDAGGGAARPWLAAGGEGSERAVGVGSCDSRVARRSVGSGDRSSRTPRRGCWNWRRRTRPKPPSSIVSCATKVTASTCAPTGQTPTTRFQMI